MNKLFLILSFPCTWYIPHVTHDVNLFKTLATENPEKLLEQFVRPSLHLSEARSNSKSVFIVKFIKHRIFLLYGDAFLKKKIELKIDFLSLLRSGFVLTFNVIMYESKYAFLFQSR